MCVWVDSTGRTIDSTFLWKSAEMSPVFLRAIIVDDEVSHIRRIQRLLNRPRFVASSVVVGDRIALPVSVSQEDITPTIMIKVKM